MNDMVALLGTECKIRLLKCEHLFDSRNIRISIWPLAHIFYVILHAFHLAYFLEISLQKNKMHVINLGNNVHWYTL